jgi:hypothetical protein
MAITFNMMGSLPTTLKELDNIFHKDEIYHDMYIFSSQEAERGIV